MSILERLARKHGTDKAGSGYTKHYEALLSNLKKEKINLLEIGVRYGSSIWMWHEYFENGTIHGMDVLRNAGYYKKYQKQHMHSSNAGKKVPMWNNEETGELQRFNKLPINQKNLLLEELKEKLINDLPKDRFLFTIGDQSKKEDLARAVSNTDSGFDVIIDDGHHSSECQHISLAYLFRHLKSGGLYVIEDIDMGIARDKNKEKAIATVTVMRKLVDEGKFFSNFVDEEDSIYLEQNVAEVTFAERDSICFIRKR